MGFRPPPPQNSPYPRLMTHTLTRMSQTSSTQSVKWPKNRRCRPSRGLSKNLQPASDFNGYVVHRRKDQAICWDVFPVEQETQGWDPDAAVLVDFGGNFGHQRGEFKTGFLKFLDAWFYRTFLGQLGSPLSTPGEGNKAHTMFKSQAIKGITHTLPPGFSYRLPKHPPFIIKPPWMDT